MDALGGVYHRAYTHFTTFCQGILGFGKVRAWEGPFLYPPPLPSPYGCPQVRGPLPVHAVQQELPALTLPSCLALFVAPELVHRPQTSLLIIFSLAGWRALGCRCFAATIQASGWRPCRCLAAQGTCTRLCKRLGRASHAGRPAPFTQVWTLRRAAAGQRRRQQQQQQMLTGREQQRRRTLGSNSQQLHLSRAPWKVPAATPRWGCRSASPLRLAPGGTAPLLRELRLAPQPPPLPQ